MASSSVSASGARGAPSLPEEDLMCPVCRDIYREPVVLCCSHSVCGACLRQFWSTKAGRECPLCRKRHPEGAEPLRNLALKNVCESVLSHRERSSSPWSPGGDLQSMSRAAVCASHGEQLKLYCVVDREPVCVVCRESQAHKCHKCQPLDEASLEMKKKLRSELKRLEEKLRPLKEAKKTHDETSAHVKCQAQSTERQIKREFEKLHEFLRDEERARLDALQVEVQQKTAMMRESMDMMTREMLTLSDTINTIQEELRADDVSFLLNIESTLERAQCGAVQYPENSCGALVNVAQHLGNLKFTVWKKMQELVSYTPVVLDPNTADGRLRLSEDLTSVTYTAERRLVPDNPERFDWYLCVLGSEGFRTGSHSWEVDVGDNSLWMLGVTTESNQRKGLIFFNSGVWCILHMEGRYRARSSETSGVALQVGGRLQRVRVQLDLDRGSVAFWEPSHNNAPLYTFTHTFSERVYPFFFTWCTWSPLTILPHVGSGARGHP